MPSDHVTDDRGDGAPPPETARKLKVVAFYGWRPADLDMVRRDIHGLADLFEAPMNPGELLRHVRFVRPDLAVVYLNSMPKPVGFAFARTILDQLNGKVRKLVVIGDGALLGTVQFDAELAGHSFHSDMVGEEQIRSLIKTDVAALRDAGRGSRETISTRPGHTGPLRSDGFHPPADDGDPLAISETSLKMIKSLSGMLGDEAISVDHFLILMFLYRQTLDGRYGVPVHEICGVAEAPYSSTMRRIAELERKNCIRKASDAKDRRRIIVTIAERSIEAVDRFITIFGTLTGHALN